jgi:hydroxyethylthiazole kinase-like uncharacterized protein yjeF
MTGATRLAASACMRVGAGLCFVVAPKRSAIIYRTTLPPHIIVEDFKKTKAHIEDKRRNAVLVGPGAGGRLRHKVLDVLQSKKACVLDADALIAFAGEGDLLFENLHPDCVLTPHYGEFQKLFPKVVLGSPAEKAEEASAIAKCTVLLKGHDSAVAAPGRDTVINQEPAPNLATAGSGDVLAGMVTGFLAQGMEAFDATCAAVHLHRMAARIFGRGLVAGDLPDLIPFAMKELGL